MSAGRPPVTLMWKQKLDEFASALLDWLMSQCAALWWLIRHNPRMTVKGLTAVAVYAAAHYGFEISAEWQALLATVLLGYLGVAGRDEHKRRLP